MFSFKKLSAGVAFAFSASVLPASAAVFVVAHPDDDILLMGPNLVNDVINGYPTVIVIVTSGDAGNGIGDATSYGIQSGQYNNQGQQYYRVRLNAHLNALQSWIPAWTKTTYSNWTWIDENFGSGAPTVERWFLGNVVVYNLNLPDELEGSSTKLANLVSGIRTSISDIRNLNTYTLESLQETIRQIISRNNHNTPTLVINYPENQDNLGDHIDHTSVGKIVASAVSAPAYQCIWQAIYPGYSMAGISVNYPNLLDRQRQGYEIAHSTLLQGGNITPISGGVVDQTAHPTWAPTTILVPTTNLQKGTMDAFHTSFYGKSQYRGAHPSNQPCAL